MVRHIIIVSFFISFGTLRAQTADVSNANFSTGVDRYVQPSEPHYRLLFGIGGNGGLSALTPQTTLGSISYEFAPSVLSAGFISSNPVSRSLPRRTYTEFDLLYGIALDRLVPHYSAPSEQFHTAISAGISFSSYQMNWRNFGRGRPPDSTFFLLPQNTSQYSIGLPIQLQAIYEPIRYVGIGALLFYTISTLQPSYGGAVVVEVRY